MQLQTVVSLPTKKLQRTNSKLTISKLAQAHERALGKARRQCFGDNEKLKKINERRRKDRLATHSATTEEAIVMRPTRRSSRWDVSHE